MSADHQTGPRRNGELSLYRHRAGEWFVDHASRSGDTAVLVSGPYPIRSLAAAAAVRLGRQMRAEVSL